MATFQINIRLVGYYLTIFFVLLSFENWGQQHIRGTIRNTKNQAVPFAHIKLEGSNLGTISNQDGIFNLYIPQDHPNSGLIEVSCIGFISKIIRIAQSNNIVLEEDIIELAEVAVVPRDYAREIIERAINNIPSNYADDKEVHTGFIREHAYWDKLQLEPVYVIESVLESIKEPYQKKHETGIVRRVEGRKFESEALDTLLARFYGGSHVMHRFDYVAGRKSFIRNSDRFEFEILDTVRIDSKNVFKISFSRKESGGYAYVIDSSFVIAEIKIRNTQFGTQLFDRGRVFSDFEIKYSNGNDEKWRFNSAFYKTAFRLGNDTLYLFNEYTTTDVNPYKEEIPYLDRVQYADIFLYNTGEYDSTFWNNYTIIQPTDNVKDVFESNEDQPKTPGRNKSGIINVLRKLRGTYQIDYFLVSSQRFTINYSSSEINIQESSESDQDISLSIANGIHYRIGKNSYIGMISSIPILTKTSNSYVDLQIHHDFNIHPGGRPIFITPALSFGYQRIAKFIGNFSHESNYKINRKTFDSGNTDISLEQRGFRLRPSFSLGIEKSSRIRFFLNIGYSYPINQKVGLKFDEINQFFIKQKKAFLANGDDGLSISTQELFRRGITGSFGIILTIE